MKDSVRRLIRRAIFKYRDLAGIDRGLALAAQSRAHQLRASAPLPSLADAEFSVNSQWGEDGIIDYLVGMLGLTTETFVEFGTQDYRESNTRYLLTNRNWRGLLIDGDQKNLDAVFDDSLGVRHDIQVSANFITAENIQNLIDSAKFGSHLGLLSVDIDGVDYWILEAITATADIVVVEYNDVFGDLPVTVPYRPDFRRESAHWSNIYWGASLAAFQHLLSARGYAFVGTNRAGSNAFFVAAAHAARIPELVESVTSWPCRFRETREQDGRVAYRRYAEMSNVIGDLPLIRVDTGQTVSARDVVRHDG
jgi:hypothetical protein